MEPDAKLVWLDLETSDLDPYQPWSEILEVACVTTRGDLEVLTEHRWVIGDVKLEVKRWNDTVVDMHSQNGLIAECVRSSNKWEHVSRDLERIILNCNHGKTQPLLCGNSVHFDRKWLSVFAPDIPEMWLSHRHIDVSSIYEMLMRSKWAPKAQEIKEAGGKAHRALEDVHASMQMYREFREVLGI